MEEKKRIIFTIIFSLIITTLFWFLIVGISIDGVIANLAVSNLWVGNSPPRVDNITINDYATSITLNPGAGKDVNCSGWLTDYNGYTDIQNATAILYNSGGAY